MSTTLHLPRFWLMFSSVTLTAVVLTGCTSGGTPTGATSGAAAAAASTHRADATGQQVADGTPIRITIGDTVMQGRLNDTTAAQNLEERLPMTVDFTNHPGGGNFPAKVYHLDPELSTKGTELGAAPRPGDIALYVPSGNLGLYYGQLDYWPGAVILGDFAGNTDLIGARTEPFTVTIEVAQAG